MPLSKLSSRELILRAFVWGEEGVEQMIGGLDNGDPYKAECQSLLMQMRAYRRTRFGERPDPFEGAVLVDVIKEVTKEENVMSEEQKPVKKKEWERPALSKLKTKEAKHGSSPCNDGAGVGGCGHDNHS